MIGLAANFLTPARLTRWAWAAFAAYWVMSALERKKTKRRERWVSRLSYTLPLLGAVALLALLGRPEARHGWLAERFVPLSATAQWTGAVLTAIGVGFAIWARRHLGTNWSGVVTLKEGHELIRTGPYRRIRHPIYTGMLLALFGTVIEIGRVAGLIAFAIAWASFTVKARREESFLAEEFGEQFDVHRQQSGMFLPKRGQTGM